MEISLDPQNVYTAADGHSLAGICIQIASAALTLSHFHERIFEACERYHRPDVSSLTNLLADQNFSGNVNDYKDHWAALFSFTGVGPANDQSLHMIKMLQSYYGRDA